MHLDFLFPLVNMVIGIACGGYGGRKGWSLRRTLLLVAVFVVPLMVVQWIYYAS